MSGCGNPMFGKPSPSKSGNGWKGWYKDTFFRSLRELSFLINFLLKENIVWKSGESKKYAIKYKDYLGKERNYFPDYITENKIYEIKPKNLWNTPLVLAKTNAAKEYAKNIGLEFILIDPEINFEQIKSLHASGEIKFTEQTEVLFKLFLNHDGLL